MGLKYNLPNEREIVKDVPVEELPEDPSVMYACVAELLTCIKEAARAKEPQINFGVFEKHGSQYLLHFNVKDLVTPEAERYNFHGQNVSQWLYAGAIVLQNKQVSRHH